MSFRALNAISHVKNREILSFSLTLRLKRKFEGPGPLTRRALPHSLAHLPMLFLGCLSQLASCVQKISPEQKAFSDILCSSHLSMNFSLSVLVLVQPPSL